MSSWKSRGVKVNSLLDDMVGGRQRPGIRLCVIWKGGNNGSGTAVVRYRRLFWLGVVRLVTLVWDVNERKSRGDG